VLGTHKKRFNSDFRERGLNLFYRGGCLCSAATRKSNKKTDLIRRCSDLIEMNVRTAGGTPPCCRSLQVAGHCGRSDEVDARRGRDAVTDVQPLRSIVSWRGTSCRTFISIRSEEQDQICFLV
jgi:hypothetical protein